MKLSNKQKGHLFLLPVYGVVGLVFFLTFSLEPLVFIFIGLSIACVVSMCKGIDYLTKN